MGSTSPGFQGWLQAILLKIYLHGTYVKQACSLLVSFNHNFNENITVLTVIKVTSVVCLFIYKGQELELNPDQIPSNSDNKPWAYVCSKGFFCWAYFRGSLFSEGLVIRKNFAFQSGFGLSTKSAKTLR